MTAAELSAALSKLSNDRPNASVRVFTLAPYTVNVEHRTNEPRPLPCTQPRPSCSMSSTDLATMVTGGKLMADNKGIEGGELTKRNIVEFSCCRIGASVERGTRLKSWHISTRWPNWILHHLSDVRQSEAHAPNRDRCAGRRRSNRPRLDFAHAQGAAGRATAAAPSRRPTRPPTSIRRTSTRSGRTKKRGRSSTSGWPKAEATASTSESCCRTNAPLVHALSADTWVVMEGTATAVTGGKKLDSSQAECRIRTTCPAAPSGRSRAAAESGRHPVRATRRTERLQGHQRASARI